MNTSWEEILRADEANQAYFAERAELPGVALFRAERADAPEFDFALIYRVVQCDADATLKAIDRQFRRWGRRARVRLSSSSTPGDWPQRLQKAGFLETDDRFDYFSVPETVNPSTNPGVSIRRVVSLEDGDMFSKIQVAGFDIPPEHQEWDRALVHRHLASGDFNFYLASLEGRPVGAATDGPLAGRIHGHGRARHAS